MKKFHISWLLGGVGVLLVLTAAVILIVSYFQNQTIAVSRYTVSSEKIPSAFDGARIVQISDLHNADIGEKLEQAVRAESPDIIVITGDLISRHDTDIASARDCLARLSAIAPLFYVAGNHEARSACNPALYKALIENGAQVLEQRAVSWTRGTETIRIIGIYDPLFGTRLYRDLPPLVDSDSYNILLYHEPQELQDCARYGVDLVLAGHAHGGQIRLPFVGGLYAPDQNVFPQYTEGVYTQGDTAMVVSRGLGNIVSVPRILNPPEIVTVVLSHE